MKLTHATKTLLAGLTLVSTLSLTACNGDTTPTKATPSTPSSSTSASPTGDSAKPSPTTTDSGSSTDGKGKGGTTAGTGSTGNSAGICRSDELEVTAVDNTIGKDEEGVVTVQFKNGGGRDCTIKGFAGVDLRTAAGDTVSVPRNGDKPRSEVLKNGESAAFNITFPVNTSGGSGIRLSKLLVTPPNETKTITLDWPAGTLPVDNHDAPNHTLQITPLGKVG
ncbi:DUF4232 domain-containing protein [Streptomyces sp. NPDC058579]|uniref:DUF4232 domain-containing protein n=1 Tax=Streptomyces sp. NPDC058579 TaxID=3346548 RepID=UPI00366961F8